MTVAGGRVARGPALVAAAGAAALAGDLALDPAHRHVPLCPFHAATGWWCPLCGGLRSAQALAHADVTTALRDNAVLVLALPLLAWAWIAWVRRDPGSPTRAVPRAAWAGLVLLAVAFTALRNLPELAWLRPS